MRRLLASLTFLLAVAGCGGEEEAARPTNASSERPAPMLELPYDLEVDSAGRVYVADGLLRQVHRHDPASGETVVVAGTGEAGTSGDGGPASRATLEEPLGLALADDGSLYVADFTANRIRRIAPDGTISTVAGSGRDGWAGDGGPAERADLGHPAAVALDPSGRYLAVPTLGNYIRRVDLETGLIETIAGDGNPRTTGEGGPAAEAAVESPHGADYDGEGNLYFPDGEGYLRRIDAGTATIETVAESTEIEATKVLVASDGALYVTTGDPSGGRIMRIAADGTIEAVVGTGSLGPSDDGMLATEIGILPSDVAFAPDGALVFSQTAPEPAVRRVDPQTGLVTTLVR